MTVLTNKAIPLDYYTEFSCEIFVEISFRGLLSLDADLPESNKDGYILRLKELSFKALQEN